MEVRHARLLNSKHVFKERTAVSRIVRQKLPLSSQIFNIYLAPLTLKLQHELCGIIYNPLQVNPLINCITNLLSPLQFKHLINNWPSFQMIITASKNAPRSITISNTTVAHTLRGAERRGKSIILENLLYFGVPLLHIDWESKPETLVVGYQNQKKNSSWIPPYNLNHWSSATSYTALYSSRMNTHTSQLNCFNNSSHVSNNKSISSLSIPHFNSLDTYDTLQDNWEVYTYQPNS